MDLKLNLNVLGARKYAKVSYPARYGCLAEIITSRHHFQFNLNGEIKFLQGTGRDWPHPSEWLKRTAGNHWVYYDTGGYNQIYDFLGEYYLPCFTYDSNSLWNTDPFQAAPIQEALSSFSRLSRGIPSLLTNGSWTPEEKKL
ncbi:MAG: radical SAM domain-containing protein, partial [Desulfobacca sp.]|nr:radical SAM domain-containing protein [Desulfobacca sp.]